MKIDYDVGDVVVRVSDVYYGEDVAPPIGKPVRVELICDSFGELGVLISGYPSPHFSRQWNAARFRKLPKADEQFTEQMRCIKPAKRKVDA